MLQPRTTLYVDPLVEPHHGSLHTELSSVAWHDVADGPQVSTFPVNSTDMFDQAGILSAHTSLSEVSNEDGANYHKGLTSPILQMCCYAMQHLDAMTEQAQHRELET